MNQHEFLRSLTLLASASSPCERNAHMHHPRRLGPARRPPAGRCRRPFRRRRPAVRPSRSRPPARPAPSTRRTRSSSRTARSRRTAPAWWSISASTSSRADDEARIKAPDPPARRRRLRPARGRVAPAVRPRPAGQAVRCRAAVFEPGRGNRAPRRRVPEADRRGARRPRPWPPRCACWPSSSPTGRPRRCSTSCRRPARRSWPRRRGWPWPTWPCATARPTPPWCGR